jgi:hypothetical protein
MSFVRLDSRTAAVIAAMAIAGCSAAGGPVGSALPHRASGAGVMSQGTHAAFGPYASAPVHRGGGWISPDAGQAGIIYGSSYNGGFINLYALKGHNQTVVGQLTNSLLSPQGMVVDGQQRLWVANTNAGNIVAFARGATTPFRILSDTNEYPISVAVDESGNVYAANAESTTGPPGNVVMYKPGATKPTTILTYSDFNIVLCLGVDAGGNVYVSYIGNAGPALMMFPKGSTTGQQVNLSDLTISDIIFDDSADLLMEDGSGGLGVWPAPYSGGPIRTIPAFGNEPTFNNTEAKVWVALANPNTPEILGYDVATGSLFDTITNGYNANAWPYGVAIDPRASLSH